MELVRDWYFIQADEKVAPCDADRLLATSHLLGTDWLARVVRTLETVMKPGLSKTHYAAALWPGLPELWLRGDFVALGWAVCFTFLLNLSILTTWIWYQALATPIWGAIWGLLVGIWVWGCLGNARFLQKLSYITARSIEPDLFPQAQLHYLQRNWFECEQLVQQILEVRPHDVEARLLWISILRRNQHYQEACELIAQTRLLAGSERWLLELVREEQQLRTLQSTTERTLAVA
jgi:hypothetical protein